MGQEAKQPPRRIAYYYAQNKEFNVSIPKRRGIGQLKSCFGYHGLNAQSIQWENERDEDYTTSFFCDLDGYLLIQLRVDDSEPGHEDAKVSVIEVLSRIFPHIDEWVEGIESFNQNQRY